MRKFAILHRQMTVRLHVCTFQHLPFLNHKILFHIFVFLIWQRNANCIAKRFEVSFTYHIRCLDLNRKKVALKVLFRIQEENFIPGIQ